MNTRSKRKKSNKKDIQYDAIELDPLEFEPKRVKVRITTMVDEHVLNALKEIAAQHGEKYQTLLNKILRAYVEGKDEDTSAVVSVKQVREIVQEELRKRA